MDNRRKAVQRRRFLTLPVAVLCLCMIWFFSGLTVYAVRSADGGTSGGGGCRSQTFELITAGDLPSDGPIGVPGKEKKKAPGSGEKAETNEYLPLVIITVGFEEQPYDDNYNWGDQIFEQQYSLKQYYKDMSFNKFTFMPVQENSAFGTDGNTNAEDKVNDGIVHVSLSRKKELGWYVKDGTEYKDIREVFPCLSDALTEAGKYMDFSAYDSNGDGAIQTNELAIGFIIAGNDAADYAALGAIPKEEEYRFLWPIADKFSRTKALYSNLPDMPNIDGVQIDDFIMIAENKLSSKTKKPSDIGVLAHELGHYIGLPDLYSMMATGTWSAYDVSYLSLMDFGCYGEDMDGNYRPYSLDIWSRIRLGWVEPKTISTDDGAENKASIAGSLTNSEDPIAVRIETEREGEYYLIENRRFTSWDEHMSRTYPAAANGSGEGEDMGGGLLVWHIDDVMYEKYVGPGRVNDYIHHPSVMPLFREMNGEKNTLIGKSVIRSNPFFDSESWGRDMFLPLYGEKDFDRPSDRRQSKDLSLSLDSPSQPVMKVHLHLLNNPIDDWANDYSSASLECLCYKCFKVVPIETSSDISSEVVKKPSSTETGIIRYTVHFLTDNITRTVEATIPPLDKETLEERENALEALTGLIVDAKRDLSGAYTEETLAELRKAIDDANAIYNDDTAIAEDVKAVQAELIRAWRLLEAKEPSDETGEDPQARKDAIFNLAKVLSDAYASIKEDDYKPGDYAEFTKVCDEAYELLESPDTTVEELQDALMRVVTARIPFEKNGRKISIQKASITGLPTVTYTGKAYTPRPAVTCKEQTLEEGKDYVLQYKNNTGAGTASVMIIGTGDYTDTATETFIINKASNPLEVKGKKATVKYKKLKKKAISLNASKTVKYIKKGQGKLSYKLAGVSRNKYRKYFKINTKTGKVTIKKGLRKGTYKLKVTIKAKGDSNYKASAKKTVSVRIVVK